MAPPADGRPRRRDGGPAVAATSSRVKAPASPLALVALLVAAAEPVPAAIGIALARLRRPGNHEALRARQCIHARPAGEVLGRLRAAVEHQQQRRAGGVEACGNVQTVFQVTGVAGETEARIAGLARCGGRRRGWRCRTARPAVIDDAELALDARRVCRGALGRSRRRIAPPCRGRVVLRRFSGRGAQRLLDRACRGLQIAGLHLAQGLAHRLVACVHGCPV